MAKVPRWERAWQQFRVGMLKGSVYRPGYGTTASQRRQYQLQEKNYWKLVQLAHDLGIKVLRGGDLGTSQDAFGDQYHVGGTWEAGRARIRLSRRGLPTLGHEMAHAVDYILSEYRPSSEAELIACGAGYVLTCHLSGMTTQRGDLEYARRKGATPEMFVRLEGHIIDVFHQIREAIEQ